MQKLFTVAVLMMAVVAVAPAAVAIPEIDAAMGVNALALISGAVMVIRSSRKK